MERGHSGAEQASVREEINRVQTVGNMVAKLLSDHLHQVIACWKFFGTSAAIGSFY